MTFDRSPTQPFPSLTLAPQWEVPVFWKIELLYDSECPLCLREVQFLKRRDQDRGLINFVDIADLSYSPKEHGNISFEDAMGRIHGILPDGRILVNVAVFRYTYEVLGLGWVYAITKIKLFENLLNGVYGLWANWRLTLTGRPPLEVITAERKMKLIQAAHRRCRLEDDDLVNFPSKLL